MIDSDDVLLRFLLLLFAVSFVAFSFLDALACVLTLAAGDLEALLEVAAAMVEVDWFHRTK